MSFALLHRAFFFLFFIFPLLDPFSNICSFYFPDFAFIPFSTIFFKFSHQHGPWYYSDLAQGAVEKERKTGVHETIRFSCSPNSEGEL